MANRPKLKVSGLGWDFDGEILEFEQARLFPYGTGTLIAVEGIVIGSYADLERIADADIFKHRPFLEITFLETIYGG
jgi:hypothetical protein